MSKIERVACDGCGKQVEASSSEPNSWYSVTIAKNYGDSANAKYDLCPACVRQANPTTWPRLAEETP